MWESRVETLDDHDVRKVGVLSQGRRLSYLDVLQHWQRDMGFREYFESLLSEAPFAAFFWETPPVARATLEQPFEFVLVRSPGLAGIRADPSAFESQFTSREVSGGVVTFSNLGGDAVLIAPCPIAPLSAYGHIATFVREAPEAQRHALWQAVGAAVERRVGPRPIWLSTSGLGVPWIHVRLDSYPKYYQHDPYRSAA
jgi:hypothetical protein